MKAYDKAAQDRIDFLEYQLDAVDIELDETKVALDAALARIRQFQAEQEDDF